MSPIITTTNLVSTLVASKRFTTESLQQIVNSTQLPPFRCYNIAQVFESLRLRQIDVLVLDVTFISEKTQQLCWLLQNKYPELQVILVGCTAEELTHHQWVYEFPSISTTCLSISPELSVLSPLSLMPHEVNCDTPLTPNDARTVYMESVVGAAIFDLNGLPREYLISPEINNMSWVQTIFQALGLRSLLMSSLKLEGFHHATIHSDDYCAVVIKQRTQYTALLVRSSGNIVEGFIEWARNFEPDELKLDPRFRIA